MTESTSTDNPTQTPQTQQQSPQQQTPTVQHAPAASLDVSGLLNAINSIPEKIVSGLKEAGHTPPPKETKPVEEKTVEEVKTTPGKQPANLSGRDKFIKWWTE